jgi:tetratricopeptide (TPR) repeat protein
MTQPSIKIRWYIDVKGDIRGPFETADVITRLIGGELKVIHRASKDRANWKAICNEVFFEQALTQEIEVMSKEALKFGPEASSDTADAKSGFHNLQNISKGISDQLQHAQILQELSVGINSRRQLLAEIASKRKLVIEVSSRQVEDEIHPDDRNEYIEPSFWARFLQRDKRFLKKLAAVLVGGLIAAGGVYRYFAQIEAEATRLTDQTREAIEAKRLGNYEKALVLFDEIKGKAKFDAKTLIEFAEAHVAQKRYMQAKDVLNSALKLATTNEERAQIYFQLAVVARLESDSAGAVAHYEKSIQEGATFEALHNLAILMIAQGDFTRAEELLLQALSMPEENKGATLLALFETALFLDQAEVMTAPVGKAPPASEQFQRLAKVKEMLIKFQTRPQSLGKQILAAQVITSAKMNEEEATKEYIRSLIDFYSSSIPKHQPSALDEQRTSWTTMFALCRELYKANNTNSLISAFFAVCAWEVSGPAGALPYAQYAHKMKSDDPWLTGLLAQLLVASQKPEDATALFRASVSNLYLWDSRLALAATRSLCTAGSAEKFCQLAAKAGPADRQEAGVSGGR